MPVVRELEDLVYAGELEPFSGPLPRGSTVELTHIDRQDLDEISAGGTRFLECAFTDTAFSAGSMKRARLNEVWMRRVRIIDVDLSETTWHDVAVLDSSLAALQVYDSRLHRVVLQGCKLSSVNFRASELTDVDFEDCVLQNVDFIGATLKNVRFPGSRIEAMALDGATLSSVDFSVATDVELISGVQSLRGAIISSGQLMTMAPAFASALGITVTDH